MRIFVDENIPGVTVCILRDLGHDVCDIRHTPSEGMTDEALWERSQKEGRLLITTDKGFSRYRGENHAGILIICLRQPNRDKIHQRVIHAVRQFSADEWKGLLLLMRDASQSMWRSSPTPNE